MKIIVGWNRDLSKITSVYGDHRSHDIQSVWVKLKKEAEICIEQSTINPYPACFMAGASYFLVEACDKDDACTKVREFYRK